MATNKYKVPTDSNVDIIEWCHDTCMKESGRDRNMGQYPNHNDEDKWFTIQPKEDQKPKR